MVCATGVPHAGSRISIRLWAKRSKRRRTSLKLDLQRPEIRPVPRRPPLRRNIHKRNCFDIPCGCCCHGKVLSPMERNCEGKSLGSDAPKPSCFRANIPPLEETDSIRRKQIRIPDHSSQSRFEAAVWLGFLFPAVELFHQDRSAIHRTVRYAGRFRRIRKRRRAVHRDRQ